MNLENYYLQIPHNLTYVWLNKKDVSTQGIVDLDIQNIQNLGSAEALIRLIKDIETPLSSIIAASSDKKINLENKPSQNKTDIIFSSSQEIKKLIDGILINLNGGHEVQPIIFELYNTNHRIKTMCVKEITPNKISKPDKLWLKKMEDEVYNSFKYHDLNLYDLSYKLAVSERQLHRKTRRLVHLTPSKYIRVLKLHKAKQYIDDFIFNTISQISFAVGYNDTHYFSKLFNQQYGVYPKDLLAERQM